MSGLLFVTAPSADFKLVNRLLLYVRDWSREDDGTCDSFVLVTSKDLDDLAEPGDQEAVETSVPGDFDAKSFKNEWAGASMHEIEDFVARAYKRLHHWAVQASLFVVLDEEGIKTKTCVLGEKPFSEDDDDGMQGQENEEGEEEETKETSKEKTDLAKQVTIKPTIYNKVRLPWDEVYITWCNLDIANMNFEEFTGSSSPDEAGWWASPPASVGISKADERAARNEAIRELKADDLV